MQIAGRLARSWRGPVWLFSLIEDVYNARGMTQDAVVSAVKQGAEEN